jgi:hypothetical protein
MSANAAGGTSSYIGLRILNGSIRIGENSAVFGGLGGMTGSRSLLRKVT